MTVKNVLFIDDVCSEQLKAKMTIGELDPSIDVQLAKSGKDALNYIAHSDSPTDLIVVDINMPGMNGYEFINRLPEVLPSNIPPVMVITGAPHLIDAQQALDCECIAGYFIKPIQRENFSAMLQYAESVP